MSFMGRNETIEPLDKNKPEDVIAAEMIEDMISNCDNWKDGSVHLATGHVELSTPITADTRRIVSTSATTLSFANDGERLTKSADNSSPLTARLPNRAIAIMPAEMASDASR